MNQTVKTIEPGTAVIDYNVTDASLEELRAKYSDMDAGSKDGYMQVTAGISEVRTIRTSVEKRRKELKKDALEYGRKVDSEAKRITVALVEIEQPMKDLKQAVDEQEEKEKAERLEIINKEIDGLFGAHIARINYENAVAIKECIDRVKAVEIEDRFAESMGKAAHMKETLIQQLSIMWQQKDEFEKGAAERKAEEERLAAERQKLELEKAKTRAENERIRKEQAEAQAKIDAENERIRKEQEAQQAEIDAAQAKIQKAEEKRLQEERDREIREKALQDAREQAEQDAKDKAEAEIAAKLEAERKEALRPDKDRLMQFAECTVATFLDGAGSLAQSPEGIATLQEFIDRTDAARNQLISDIEAM